MKEELKMQNIKNQTLGAISFIFLLVACKSDQVKTVISEDKDKIMNIQVPSQLQAPSPYDVQYVMGHFDPIKHPDFKEIPIQYADQKGRYMHHEALDSFIAMHKSASQAGIQLTIKSAVRNFDYQKGIWERKWTGATVLSDGTNVAKDIHEPHDKASKILEYSSMPGTSRHHWGTDIDLNAFNNQYFESGVGLKTYQWLRENALKYGYGQPYTPKGSQRPNGYNEEKWHWSYLPIAKTLTDVAKDKLSNEMIQGFEGSKTAIELNVKENYILGIASDCL